MLSKEINNYCEISGVVTAEPQFSHEVSGEKFKKFIVAVKRLSGTCDYINVISEHEKVDTGETALQTKFGEGTIVTGNDGIILEHALYVVGEDRMDDTVVVVVVNSQTKHGTCSMYAPEKQNDYGSGFTIGCNTIWDLWNLISHECAGHGFTKLADEYVNYNGPIPEEDKATYSL